MAMSLFALAILIGPAVGPTIGGYIVDHYSWEWIFYINLPVGLLGLVMVISFVHDPPDILEANRRAAPLVRKNMDWWGIGLMAAGLASLQYVLEEGNRNDWFQSKLIVFLMLFSATSLAAFVIRELTAPVPAVDVRLFKDPVFLSGTLVGSLMFAMLISLTFLLPVFMQELLGFTATQSGNALVPRALAMMVGIPLVGRLYNVIQPRILVCFGVVLVAFSTYLMAHYTLDTSARTVTGAIIIQGFGFASLFVPLTTVAMMGIPRYRLADAAGLNSLVRQIGGSLGLAAFATLLPRFVAAARTGLVAHVVAGSASVTERLARIQQGLIGRGVDPGDATSAARRLLGGLVERQAMVLAFERLFLLAGVAFLFVLPLGLFLRPPRGAGPVKPDIH